MKPYLRDFVPTSYDDIPEATAIGCLNCYLYCPDGVIFREGSKVGIDYDFCKGCGICSKICKLQAIKMEAEK